MTLFVPLLMSASVVIMSAAAESPDGWSCVNQVEVWCGEGACAAKADDEMTPMDITAYRDGRFAVCAYTGCWEGRGDFADIAGRLLWVGDNAPFSTATGDASTNVTLVIDKADGVGFVRAGGLASPLLCKRREQARSTIDPAK